VCFSRPWGRCDLIQSHDTATVQHPTAAPADTPAGRHACIIAPHSVRAPRASCMHGRGMRLPALSPPRPCVLAERSAEAAARARRCGSRAACPLRRWSRASWRPWPRSMRRSRRARPAARRRAAPPTAWTDAASADSTPLWRRRARADRPHALTCCRMSASCAAGFRAHARAEAEGRA